MKLIALETSGVVLSLAAFEDAKLLKESSAAAPMRQNETLAPMFRELLEALSWKAAGLDAVAISLGPGSFAGLRSGLAFAKGLAYGSGAKLIGVPTLDAWAEPVAASEVLVWLDARKGHVYRAAFAQGKSVLPAVMLPLQEARAEAFPGFAHVGDTCGLPGNCSAASVGRLALKSLALQATPTEFAASLLEPIYLRRSEAELLWEKRHG